MVVAARAGDRGVHVLVTPSPQYAALWRRAVYWASLAIALETVVANFKDTALFTRNIYAIHVFFIAWLAHERNAHRP